MITLIDYNAGNLTSVRLAIEALGENAVITSDADVVRRADRIIFPGVGAAGAAMLQLNTFGLVDAIKDVLSRGMPFLGICLGTQILLETSEEDGGVTMLECLPGCVKRFQPTSRYDKVPQIGWNQVEYTQQHQLFDGIISGSDFYFVHSYYPSPEKPEDCLAVTEYANTRFASVLARDNLVATQFHPEKSGKCGLKLLENFVKWKV
ncbi:MAG: imidazole glycerol phosphate synthase subunit HisH [Planctomycetaceae bacterium]|jgi:glutamine amidotransferase|nr:imidazole glycerol phosphate synthase subunit HisH [Planctomycetaceae bacterium]